MFILVLSVPRLPRNVLGLSELFLVEPLFEGPRLLSEDLKLGPEDLSPLLRLLILELPLKDRDEEPERSPPAPSLPLLPSRSAKIDPVGISTANRAKTTDVRKKVVIRMISLTSASR